tara:strand:+ start:28 stop:978 length:951 start_codon:yes stop_codon:yes gene_type:complete
MFSSELWQKPVGGSTTELTTQGIMAWGTNGNTGGGTAFSVSNLISTSGVVASDTTGVGTNRWGNCGATYSDDKGIFFGGYPGAAGALTNLVSNSGVVATDTTMVGRSSEGGGGMRFGGTKALFAFGTDAVAEALFSTSRIVDDNGVVGSEVTGVGFARYAMAGGGGVAYGGDKGIIAFGHTGSAVQNMSNLVSNEGVVASDTTGVGTGRWSFASATYGEDKAIYGLGRYNAGELQKINLVSNTGVIASDTSTVAKGRRGPAGCGYGSDKGIFSFGASGTSGSGGVTNLISNSGVVASDVTQVGSDLKDKAGLGFAN